ncbi:MAG: hypothetical protein K2J04_09280, partial [Lachnospiraceae bacterium]|nr:hypothetical protein [Lachnospiraceae bacterium]
MNILRKILYALLLFFVLCCALIGLCAMNPDMSEKIAETLHIEDREDDSDSAVADSDTDMENDADNNDADNNNADNEENNDNDAESAEQPTDVVVTGTSGSSEKPVYE